MKLNAHRTYPLHISRNIIADLPKDLHKEKKKKSISKAAYTSQLLIKLLFTGIIWMFKILGYHK